MKQVQILNYLFYCFYDDLRTFGMCFLSFHSQMPKLQLLSFLMHCIILPIINLMLFRIWCLFFSPCLRHMNLFLKKEIKHIFRSQILKIHQWKQPMQLCTMYHHRVSGLWPTANSNYESNSCQKECQLSFGGPNKKKNQNRKV